MPYTLVVTEKPSAARRIASALAEGTPEKKGRRGTPYYSINRGGKELLVVPAVGHLFVLDEKNGGLKWEYPAFDIEWKPTYTRKGSEWAKKYFDSMEKLAKGADDFISACDYDVEGSVIAFNILRFIAGVEDGKRMKFSTLTTPDLLRAYDTMSEHLDFPQIEAGLTRHQLDWYFGVNMSRALTISLEKSGAYKTLSTGRVQGPTLQLLLKREEVISAFRPRPYWELELKCTVNGEELTALHAAGKFWDKEAAERVLEKCKDKDGTVASISKEEQQYYPPVPFDLTTLQRESYGLFGFSPKTTLDIAQTLYEQALISYPRTGSQKLPPTIGYKSILKRLEGNVEYSELCGKILKKEKLWPRQGKKEDPAHPAIFPTGNPPKKVNSYQKKLYDLIVKRFLATFSDPAVRESVKATVIIRDEEFVASGATTIEKGWMEFYEPYVRIKEVKVPEMHENDHVKNEKLTMHEKETQPPKRYTQASVLKEMEDLGLGTKGTRANILDTLYTRGYIKERSIVVTELGKAVVKALEKHCPEIVSVELTRRFDEDMEKVQAGEKRREDILKDAENELMKILEKFRAEEKEIGEEIKEAVQKYEEEENNLGPCPKCGKGRIMVIRSQKTGKRFAGCNNYPECSNSYPLPQKGTLSVVSKKCHCGLSLVEVKTKGRRPWKLCVEHGFDYNKKDGRKAGEKEEPENE
jgi:DNA topoisomerase-1